MSKNIKRRDFLRKSALGALGLSAFPGLINASSFGKLKTPPPSDRLRIAHIGLGAIGNQHMNWFAAFPDVDIVARFDADQEHVGDTMETLRRLKPDTKA